MSRKMRGIVVLGVGMALGLSIALTAALVVRHNARPPDPALDESFALLVDVLDQVRTEYVDALDERRLVEGAIRGIFAELDEHSRFLDAAEYEDIRIATSGSYTGVGLDLRLREGRITVIEPLFDAPAYKAGILPGDVVVSVDAVPVDGQDVAATINRMRGAPGTPITLGVMREGELEPRQFALVRVAIEVKTVRSAYLGDGYAYVRLSGFADGTRDDLELAVAELREEAGRELEGLVLDLRDNPGGVFESAVEVADLFLENGLIVRGSGRVRQARFAQYAHPGDTLERVPVAVLVNGGSASGAEIVAGSIQDHVRGPIVGERTYGKSSVQSVFPLAGGNALKLTTSRYLMASGESINGNGIEPNVLILAAGGPRYAPGTSHPAAIAADVQLEQALRAIGYDPIALSRAP
jgi:carboxyl-terminal processing protease